MHFTLMLYMPHFCAYTLYIIFVIVAVVLYVQEQDLGFIKEHDMAEMNFSTRLND